MTNVETSDDDSDGPVLVRYVINPYKQPITHVLADTRSQYAAPPTLLGRFFDRQKISNDEEDGEPPANTPPLPSENRGNPHNFPGERPFVMELREAAPIWTIAILIPMSALLIIHAIQMPFSAMDGIGECGALAIGARWGPLITHGGFWRFATSIFVHRSAGQLAFTIVLHALSWHFERRFGFWKAALTWIACAVYGEFLSGVVVPFQVTCGPSAGVFGWAAIQFVAMATNSEQRNTLKIVTNAVIVVIGIIGGLFALCDTWANIGGFGFGLLLSVLVLPAEDFTGFGVMVRTVGSVVAFPAISILFIFTAIMGYSRVGCPANAIQWCYKINGVLWDQVFGGGICR
jgi:rhomboid protease GluP